MLPCIARPGQDLFIEVLIEMIEGRMIHSVPSVWGENEQWKKLQIENG